MLRVLSCGDKMLNVLEETANRFGLDQFSGLTNEKCDHTKNINQFFFVFG
jgi:hypothetical protein